jgi:chaperone modulatory protein CbpM
MSQPRRYPLARPWRLSLDGFAGRAGLHPQLVRRLVTLGLVQATRDGAGNLWFSPAELGTVARIQRLRAGLSLNYAALCLVLDLLDRIDVLERELRTRPHPPAKE